MQARQELDSALVARVVRVCDDVLAALQDYPERDEAIAALARRINEERLQLLATATTRHHDA